MQKKEGSRKHLSLRQRIYIEVGILKGESILEMAKHLRFSRQTIYREILGNSFLKNKQSFNRVNSELSCLKLSKYPFVCNTCSFKQSCSYLKRYYYAEEAHESASSRLVMSRSGTRLSKGEILTLEQKIGPGLSKGQSLHHIMTAGDKRHFIVGERTIRNLINRGELAFHNIDLPMTVRFKVSKKKTIYPKRSHMPEVLLGRTYADFKDLVHFGDHYAQIDSVIGKQSDKQTIITIIFPTLSFIFGFISPEKGWLSVNNGLIDIFEKLGPNLFKKVFPVIISDRGTEFDNLYKIEKIVDKDGVVHSLTKTFYADPYTSNQRAELESNHRFIRRFLPKSHSFKNLTQAHLDLMFSHINGVIRAKQNNKTGYELAKAYLGEDFLKAINISYVAPEDVVLKPFLFDQLK